MKMDEFVWINGFENLYKINRKGEVWSEWYKKLMTPQTSEDGYLWVKLRRAVGVENNILKREEKKGYIHRLLALQFIENPDNLPQIDHIDRNKLNNDLANLRWCSQHTNRNNRLDLLILRTEEQLKERTDALREYKRKFAEDTRRAKGIAKKEKVKTANEKEYKRNKMAEYRENYTEEKKAEVRTKKREAYDNENQKEYVNRPEVKERRLAEQTRKRALVKTFNTLPFAEV